MFIVEAASNLNILLLSHCIGCIGIHSHCQTNEGFVHSPPPSHTACLVSCTQKPTCGTPSSKWYVHCIVNSTVCVIVQGVEVTIYILYIVCMGSHYKYTGHSAGYGVTQCRYENVTRGTRVIVQSMRYTVQGTRVM